MGLWVRLRGSNDLEDERFYRDLVAAVREAHPGVAACELASSDRACTAERLSGAGALRRLLDRAPPTADQLAAVVLACTWVTDSAMVLPFEFPAPVKLPEAGVVVSSAPALLRELEHLNGPLGVPEALLERLRDFNDTLRGRDHLVPLEEVSFLERAFTGDPLEGEKWAWLVLRWFTEEAVRERLIASFE